MGFKKYLFLWGLSSWLFGQSKAQQSYFEPNIGQIEFHESISQPQVLAIFHHPLGDIYVLKDRLRLKLYNQEDKPLIHQSFHFKDKDTFFDIRYQVFDIKFNHANSSSKVQFLKPAKHYINYFLGNNQQNWKSNVHPFQEIHLQQVYKHIDLKIYTVNQQVEFDWILHPGADPTQIELSFEGHTQTKIQSNNIYVKGKHADFNVSMPKAFKKSRFRPDIMTPLTCKYIKSGDNTYRLSLNKVHPTDTVIIDPVLVFSTYSGSTADNFGFTATYDNQGCLYAGGIVDASSRSYPVTTGAFQVRYGGSNNAAEPVYLPCDISISKYSPDGSTLLYATYLGGSNNEYPHSIATDLQGNLLLLGSTVSTNYPVHTDSAFQKTIGGGYDIVLTKFNPTGSALLGSTYLGGSLNDGFQTNNGPRMSSLIYNYADNYRGDITTDNFGNVYVATCAQSENLNGSTNAYQKTIKGETDALVFSTSPNFSTIRWMSFYGGTADDAAYSCRLDKKGNLFVGGGTASPDFPIEGSKPFSRIYQQDIDGFILKLNAFNGNYQAGTYWGTAGNSPGSTAYDQIYFIDIDADDKVYFTGQTTGAITRSVNTYGQDFSGQMIGRLSNNLDSLEFITTFGNSNRGNPDLCPSAFMVDDCYNIYFSGWGSVIGVGNNGTTSGLEITPDAHQSTTDNNDFYLLALSRDAEKLLYASYFGGNQSDDHVDGGTSRFDKRGIVYQSVCASCPERPPGLNDFPTTPNAAFTSNVSIRCSNASFKLDFRLGYSIDAEFQFSQTLCLKEKSQFVPYNRHNADYFWDFGDGDTSRAFDPVHIYKDTGTYNVTLKVIDTQSCNVYAERSYPITIIQAPEATLTFATNPCKEEIELKVSGFFFDSIFWDFGDGSAPRYNTNPINHVFPKGTYNAQAIVYNSKTLCLDTVLIPISDTSEALPDFSLANTFTPNDDGFNDCFKIFGFSDDCEKGEIRIFNRWGARVFYSNKLGSFCWNGKVDNSGEPLPSGTYFYIIDIAESYNPKLPKKINGIINLLKD
jgi:gliding motility-associated-like protein